MTTTNSDGTERGIESSAVPGDLYGEWSGTDDVLYSRERAAARDVLRRAKKRAEEVNVRDFGAAGDQVADDTAAIQAAFESAGQGGRIVFEGKK